MLGIGPSAALAESFSKKRADLFPQGLATSDLLVPAAGLGLFLFWSYLKLIATFESTAGYDLGRVLVLTSLGGEAVAFALAVMLSGRTLLQPSARLAACAALLCAAGSTMRYWAAAVSGSTAVAIAGSALMAFGFAYLVCQWGHYFKRNDPRSTTIIVIMAFACATALLGFSGLALNYGGKMALLAVSPLVAAALFWRSLAGCEEAARPRVEFRASVSSRFAFFAGGAVTALMMGNQFFQPSPESWTAVSVIALVALVALLGLLPLFASGKVGALQLCQASFALMLFGYLGVAYVGSDLAMISTSVAILGFLLVDLLAWCIPAEAAYWDQENAVEIMAKARLLVNGGSLIGMMLLVLASDHAEVLSVGGLGLDGFTALGVILLFSATLFMGGFRPPIAQAGSAAEPVSNSDAGDEPQAVSAEGQTFADALESERVRHLEICQSIGDRAGLSQRERDVFVLLAQGRSRSFIQEDLCISKGTANTHISSIYRKLDVHGQQELLTLFYDEVWKLNEGTRS